MNKSFINKQSGIKRNVISKLIWLLLLPVVLFLAPTKVQAASQTYTQAFQNQTTSVSGTGIYLDQYFIKQDYWQIESGTLNLNYKVSPLADDASSDITVELNGVTVNSFRPKNQSGQQTQRIDLPVNLIQSTNHLVIRGQVETAVNGTMQRTQTPANWLTVYDQSQVNLKYQLSPMKNTIKSFYQHFSGQDTIVNGQSVIATSASASNGELSSASYALAGYSRIMTNEQDQVPITSFGNKRAKSSEYMIAVATYHHLPAALQDKVKAPKKDQASVQLVEQDGQHVLVVTATSDAALTRAARYVANHELMMETTKAHKTVTKSTQIATSVLQYQGKKQLTQQDVTLQGEHQQTASFFVNLPIDRTNADGSRIYLHYRYAKNLDFDRSLMTVRINNQVIASHKLTEKDANAATLSVAVPRNMALGNSFVVRVTFDLELKGQVAEPSQDEPFATIESSSYAAVKSQQLTTQLFSNYPSLYLRQETFDQIALVRPNKMTATDFKTLTNIVNLLGNFAKSNTGTIQFYTGTPSEKTLVNRQVIAFGTPKQTPLIAKLNDHLYFKYNKAQTQFLGNEKLSIESDYGHTIGVAQLITSPYNSQKTVLVVSGATSQGAYLASTQINFQKNIAQYDGDAIVVDTDNQHMSYRFKKQADPTTFGQKAQGFIKQRTLWVYLLIAAVVLILVGLTIVLLLRKYGRFNQKEAD
ncbi:cellulose biosynthesis cyclic di-GMP-binding regulatory protein BcsB [Lacticaseibacillus saniviri]